MLQRNSHVTRVFHGVIALVLKLHRNRKWRRPGAGTAPLEAEGRGAEDANVATERVVGVKSDRREVSVVVEVENHLDVLVAAGVLGALPAHPLVAASSPAAAALVLPEVASSLVAVCQLTEPADKSISAGDDRAVVRVVEEVEVGAATITLTYVVRY